MRDSDIDSLSADGAQDSSQIMSSEEMQSDPRAALADMSPLHQYLHDEGVLDDDEAWHRRLCDGQPLAERGVLLVTEEGLRAALHEWFCGNVNHPVTHTTTGCVRGAAAMMLWLEGHPAIAALSADK